MIIIPMYLHELFYKIYYYIFTVVKKKQKAATAPETLLFFVVILYIKKYQFAVKINVSDREL